MGFFMTCHFYLYICRNKKYMSSIPLYIVVNSHLSDSLIEMDFNPELASQRIRFVKVLTNMFSDLSQRIEEDELNRIWKEKII